MSKPNFDAQIDNLVKNRSWPQLVSALEEFELAVANEHNIKPHYSIQLFAYLIVNNLVSARYLWKRIPSKIRKEHLDLATAWAIGKAMWQNRHQDVYTALNSHNWDGVHRVLAEQLLVAYRQRELELLSRAYTTLSEQSLASHLGLGAAEATKLALESGKFEQKDGYLVPKTAEKGDVQDVRLENLKSLSQYVVFLEQK